MSESGILVLDNNCYKDLVDVDARRRLLRAADMVDLIPAPSAVNLAESICAADAQRAQLLTAMRGIMKGHPLLPWPLEMLADAGRRLLIGEGHGFDFGETGLEWLLDDPVAAGEDREHTHAALLDTERRMSERFERQRPTVQRWMKEHSARGHWESAREFLDYWWEGDMAEAVARFYWRQLVLPGDAPVALLCNE